MNAEAVFAQYKAKIRIIGDPILHQPGRLFPNDPTADDLAELHRQIQEAKRILIATSGAGIAANQCATIKSPYQFAIVGIFKDNPSHVEGVKKRYPGVDFPAAKILLNPVILSADKNMQTFQHACLSVPGPNKCEIDSPCVFTVQYLDPTDLKVRNAEFKSINAVVLWHEMNHILAGKTYIDTALAALSATDLMQFSSLVAQELTRRNNKPVFPELTVPPFYITITTTSLGISQLNENQLKVVLPKHTTETLLGFLASAKDLNDMESGKG